jgi:hypothetical protein
MTYKLTLKRYHADSIPEFVVELSETSGRVTSASEYHWYATMPSRGKRFFWFHQIPGEQESQKYGGNLTQREALRRAYKAAKAKADRLSANTCIHLENLAVKTRGAR